MLDNPYTVLGLRPGATLADAKRAFRRLAMAWHPDRNTSAEAEERFKRIRRAYDLILDPERYAAWAAVHAGSAAPAEDAEAPPPSAADHVIHLSLEEAAFGCEKAIRLPETEPCGDCAGSGRIDHRHSVACASCRGCGRVGNGRQGTRHCSACAGRGYVRVSPCASCAGSGRQERERTLRVRIPAGSRSGNKLRVRAGKRAPGARRDLYLEIALDPHPLFALDGDDLICTLPASVLALLAGSAIEVPTLAGTTRLAFPPFTGAVSEHRLAGLGFPKPDGGAGDLRLRLSPVFPQDLDEAARQQLRCLDERLAAARWPDELNRWQDAMSRRRRG